MSVINILSELTAKGIELKLINDEELSIRAKKGELSNTLKQEIINFKQEIIALLRKNGVGSTKDKQIFSFHQNDYPLSYGQERIFFHELLHGNTATYNVPYVVKLNARLEPAQVEKAFHALVKKHPALRTQFLLKNNEPRQIIAEYQPENIIFNFYKESSLQQSLVTTINEEITRPFCLDKAPLARLTLVHLPQEQSLLCLVLHHIVCDAWSLSALLGDFQQYLRSPIEVKPSSLNMGDVAIYERAWLTSLDCQHELDYWLNKLANYPSRLEFKKPFQLDAEQQGKNYYFDLPGDLCDEVIRYAARLQVSIADILFSAYALLVAIATCQKKVIIGMAATQRDKEELADLVGFAVNTLPVPIDLQNLKSANEFLQHCHHAVIEALDNKNVPFDLIVAKLGLQRTLEETPLIQAMFTYHESDDDQDGGWGVECERIETDIGRSKTSLTLGFVRKKSQLNAGFEFATHLFSLADIKELADLYQQVLVKLLKNEIDPVIHLQEAFQPRIHIDKTEALEIEKTMGTKLHELSMSDNLQNRTLENNLIAIACELLGLATISRSANFFEMGGNSLIAIRFVAKAREAGINITLKQVFKHQTVAQICAHMEHEHA